MSPLTVPAPSFDRSLTQRRDALEHANQTRIDRARWKRDVKAGRRSARLAILDPPGFLASMSVGDFLVCVPKVGRVKAGKLWRDAELSPSRRLDGLSARQRQVLAGLLGGER